MLSKILLGVLVLLLLGGAGLWWAAHKSRSPLTLGLVDGRLRPCPSSPNCVSSDGGQGAARVAPLAAGAGAARALEALTRVLGERGDTRIEQQTPHYLHATARTRWFGFVDDVELFLDTEADILHVRSASRVGRSDFGANATRVEELRTALLAALRDSNL